MDDDGQGNGPFRIRLTVWREGGKAVLDFAGSSAQAEGPINLYMRGTCSMVTGIVLIMVSTRRSSSTTATRTCSRSTSRPGRSQPGCPAPLGNRRHTLARWSTSSRARSPSRTRSSRPAPRADRAPHFLFSGRDGDGEVFLFYEINYGGIPGRPVGDGMDGHAGTRSSRTRRKYPEAYFPRVRSLRERAGLGGRGPPPRRQRGAEGLRVPRPGLGVDLRRPRGVAPVGDRGRSPRRTLAQATRPAAMGRRRISRRSSTSWPWRRATGFST